MWSTCSKPTIGGGVRDRKWVGKNGLIKFETGKKSGVMFLRVNARTTDTAVKSNEFSMEI